MLTLLLAAVLSGPVIADSDGNGATGGLTMSGSFTLNDDVRLNAGTALLYWLKYGASGTQLEFWTTNSDGGGTDLKWLVVDDGTAVADFQGGRITNSTSVLRIGTTCTASHSQAAGGYCFGGVGEFEANTFLDGSTFFGAAARVASGINFAFGDSDNARLLWNTTQTAPSMWLSVDNTAHMFVLSEVADSATNLGLGNQTHPTMVLTTANVNTTATQYRGFAAAGTYGELFKTLTETTPTAIVQVPIAAEAGVSGELIYTVYATDGSTPQTRSGRVIFSAVNDGGTETCVLGTVEELDNTPTGTLTATVACSTSPTNGINFTIDATSSLTQTTLQAYYYVLLAGAGNPLPQ